MISCLLEQSELLQALVTHNTGVEAKLNYDNNIG